MDREVTLTEVLAARERRVERQRALQNACGTPLISFSMNIAGPVKSSPLIRRAFSVGRRRLEAALQTAGLPVLERQEEAGATGCEALYAVSGEAPVLKRLCVAIEDDDPLGRLFDMDVLTSAGEKLDREAVGGGERRCIVCGAAGRGCASRRVHRVEELQAATRRIMERHFFAADCTAVDNLVSRALWDEVSATPKPGLVDRANTGSHRDMDRSTFRASIEALRGYWAACAAAGQKTAGLSPEETFRCLREMGKRAEQTMLAATGGVNTHKGAVFTLGTICGAIGRLWRPEAPCRDASPILDECRAMAASAVAADLAAAGTVPASEQTAGLRLYLAHGMTGIRGEMADGMPGLRRTALPALEKALDAGRGRNDAGVIALLHLIARGTDTNMAARGGAALAAEATERVRKLLAGDPMPDMHAVARLDEYFTANNLSPGGCADLLAAAYFLHDWQETED